MGPEQISIWVSERRFAPFVERAEGERALAVELYLWQARVAGASLTTLAHFEALLRNAVNRRLGAGYGTRARQGNASSGSSRIQRRPLVPCISVLG